ncbi:phage holin family protein [Candidatus Saccharibacteria bacterium]|nr:phage holin family protein [Candidatus Saccharibacteria bacterium]
MVRRQFLSFILRWFVSSVAMYVCINFFATFSEGSEEMRTSFWLYVSAGLIFSVINTVVKPIATIFALPFIFITLGLFTILVNAAMVGLTIWLMPDVSMTFWGAIESCLLISLINYLVNLAMPDVK